MEDRALPRPAIVRTAYRLLLCLALAGSIAHAAAVPQQPRINSSSSPAAVDNRSTTNALPAGLGPLLLAEASNLERRTEPAQVGPVAVIYPDMPEPFRSIFGQIISGIEDNDRVPVRAYAIGPGADIRELQARVRRSGARVVIALGRQGLRAASGLERDLPVLVSGVLSIPEAQNQHVTGFSLTPDPGLLFQRLKSFFPNIRRVTVVYNPLHNEWLIKLARDAARAYGLELVTHEARDLATAVRAYESSLGSMDGRRDAIWLPQDASTVDESAILPLVLRESWNRGVPLFSSSLLHVRKGALFALYPNNVELGRSLIGSALALMQGEPRRRGLWPLREVNTAVNLRTASHLGLNIGYQQQRSFDYVFPEP